jgi:hypothetical protein
MHAARPQLLVLSALVCVTRLRKQSTQVLFIVFVVVGQTISVTCGGETKTSAVHATVQVVYADMQ